MALCITTGCFSVFANEMNAEEESPTIVDIIGEPGDEFDLGNGFRCIIMDEEMYYGTMAKNGDNPRVRTITYLWSFANMGAYDRYDQNLGYYLEADVSLTSTYPYCRIYFDNTQTSNQKTTMAVYFANTGQPSSSIFNVFGGSYYYIYSIGQQIGDFYIGYYSPYPLSGSTYCFKATTQGEVDYDE